MGGFQDTLGKVRGTATEVVEVFEDLLERHNISIPDEYRTGAQDETRIYGETYGSLVDCIAEILADYVDE